MPLEPAGRAACIAAMESHSPKQALPKSSMPPAWAISLEHHASLAWIHSPQPLLFTPLAACSSWGPFLLQLMHAASTPRGAGSPQPLAARGFGHADPHDPPQHAREALT